MIDVTVTLVQLAFVATVMTVALEQIFDTRLYQKYLGKGLDGQGSIYFRDWELRPWISTAAGVALAVIFRIRAIESGLGAEFLASAAAHGGEAALVDTILTGIIIGGGTKSIKKVANRLAATQSPVAKLS